MCLKEILYANNRFFLKNVLTSRIFYDIILSNRESLRFFGVAIVPYLLSNKEVLGGSRPVSAGAA